MKVVVVHPDLGIGGAERLVLDAALAIQETGHEVQIVTNHYRKDHSFIDTFRFHIKTIDYFPRSVFGVGRAFCAYIRMCLAALYVCIWTKPDLIFCDSISACLVVFRFFRFFGLFPAPIIFYCHFPDQLLTERKNVFKKAYRWFIDWFEAWTIDMADLICVNSLFTRNVVKKTFPKLRNRHLHILYPSINVAHMESQPSLPISDIPPSAKYIFVSINRYERKKNIRLALDAFAVLKDLITESEYDSCFLVIAGGYDQRNQENCQHYNELTEHAAHLELTSQNILFMKSPSDEQKLGLLKRATAVLYTPSFEHFGIVPVEAMFMRCCVIAPNSGGPVETVIDGKTGFLVEPNAEAFADKMALLVSSDPIVLNEIGDAGHAHIQSKFTMRNFAFQLNCLIRSLVYVE